MWSITVRSANNEPREYQLKAGKNRMGRKADNEIALSDESASRFHAELNYDPTANTVLLTDLESLNGTFVNRERITQPRFIKAGDQIRIGEHVITLIHQNPLPTKLDKPPHGTQPLTRELLLESLDHNAMLLYEVASRLNTVIDIDTALREVADLMKTAMAADRCEVILSERFDQLGALGFPTSIAQMAIDQKSAVIIPEVLPNTELGKSALLMRIRSAMCVPVMVGDQVAALVYVYKNRIESRPFDRGDLQIAVAISHQAALTIQRARLLRRVRREQRMRQFFHRFLSAPDAEAQLEEYLQTGVLPELQEQQVTIIFADLRESTYLAERVGARKFGQILNHYYQDMTQIIFDHGGMLNKFLGDGVLAVFGANTPRPDSEGRAVNACLMMLAQIATISQAEGEKLDIGIGVNTGVAMAGYVGSEERMEFTVLGDTVNVAQRLQTLARPNRIFAGPVTHYALKGRFNFREMGPIEVRGRSQPVETFEVLPSNTYVPHATPPFVSD